MHVYFIIGRNIDLDEATDEWNEHLYDEAGEGENVQEETEAQVLQRIRQEAQSLALVCVGPDADVEVANIQRDVRTIEQIYIGQVVTSYHGPLFQIFNPRLFDPAVQRGNMHFIELWASSQFFQVVGQWYANTETFVLVTEEALDIPPPLAQGAPENVTGAIGGEGDEVEEEEGVLG